MNVQLFICLSINSALNPPSPVTLFYFSPSIAFDPGILTDLHKHFTV